MNVHPGFAKNVMVNAALIGTEIAAALPADEIPARTEGYEGFFHLCSFEGTTTYAELDYIIRDFDKTSFENRKNLIQSIVDQKNAEHNNCIELELTDQYYNMISQIEPHMEIVDLAKQAMLDCGITPIIQPIRGGTDGARLSFMGLPCPNLFAGGHNFHSNLEFVPVESMEKAVEMIVRIAELATSLDFQKTM
jgi:tripeptide aminopeptidase